MTGTPLAQNTSGTQGEQLTYYVGSAGPFGTYKIKVTSADLAATYTLSEYAPAYAPMTLELIKPNGLTAASTSTRGATISHTPSSTGIYTYRVSIASGWTQLYTLSQSYPILQYPAITMSLFNPQGDPEPVATDTSPSGLLSLAYSAADPGGAYRVDITNVSGFSTPLFTLITRSTSVDPVTQSGSLAAGGSASFTTVSAGTGTLQADLDWTQGQATATNTVSGSLGFGASPFDHPISVTSTHAPITGSLDWTTFGYTYDRGGCCIQPLDWSAVDLDVQGPGLIRIVGTWQNPTNANLTSQTHLNLSLYPPSDPDMTGTPIATGTPAGGQPQTLTYTVPAGGQVGSYRVKIASADLGASWSLDVTEPHYADLSLQLVNPSGAVVASSSGRPATISYSPPTIGDYTYRVSTTGFAAPSYTLSQSYPILAYANVVAKLYDSANVLRAQSSGRPGSFYFQGATAGTYRVDLVNSSTNIPVPLYTLVIRPPATRTADLDLQLLNAAGSVVAEPADHSVNPESLAYPNAPAASYTLRVIARRYAASFTLDHTTPSTQSVSTTYDAAGRTATQVDAAGTKSFAYDAADRLTGLTLPAGGGTRSFEYFADGAAKKITDPTGVQAFTYDRAGRLGTATDQAGVVTSYGYDAASNQSTITRAGVTVTSTFDDAERLVTRTAPAAAPGTASFAYDDLVDRTKVTAAAGDVDVREYNKAGQITDVESAPAAGAPPVVDVGFDYDAAGARINRQIYDGAGNQVPIATFGYDGAGRLTAETFTVAGVSKTQSYSYDAQGNRTQMTAAAGTTTSAYNPAGQLLRTEGPSGATAYLYDARGNLTKTIGPAGTASYTWTPDNRLASLSAPGKPVVSFTYDADGTRRTKTVGSATTTYAWEQGSPVSESTSGATTSYTYDDAGAPLTIKLASGAVYTYHYDEAGSVAQLTDAAHAAAASYTYDAWGNVVDQSGTQAVLGANSYLYRGAYGVRFDKETGLYLMGARYYDPVPGRFVSRDPADADLGQSSYLYAGNDPVMQLDPTGLSKQADSGTGLPPGLKYDWSWKIGRGDEDDARYLNRSIEDRPNKFFPFKVHGGAIRVGRRLLLKGRFGPGFFGVVPFTFGPVEVVTSNNSGFAFRSLAGHAEGRHGIIVFGVRRQRGNLMFQVHGYSPQIAAWQHSFRRLLIYGYWARMADSVRDYLRHERYLERYRA